jgi:DNA-binding CsgD family transcriptional regulator
MGADCHLCAQQPILHRARIVLMTAEGISPGVIGQQLAVSQPTVRK